MHRLERVRHSLDLPGTPGRIFQPHSGEELLVQLFFLRRRRCGVVGNFFHCIAFILAARLQKCEDDGPFDHSFFRFVQCHSEPFRSFKHLHNDLQIQFTPVNYNLYNLLKTTFSCYEHE